MAPTCAGCLKTPTGREFLTCSLCSAVFDLDCANVSSARFYNTMTAIHKAKWKCPTCMCKMPKKDNTNTPARALEHNTNTNYLENIQRDNITMRKKISTQERIAHDESTCSDDPSILGDTLYQTTPPKIEPQTELTLQNFSKLITEKLKENNISMISLIENTIQTEINRAITQIKHDLKQETDSLQKQINERKLEIVKLTQEIETMKKQYGKLKEEIVELGHKNTPSHTLWKGTEDNAKKFVLYGMEETYKEPEYALHFKIIDFFRNTLNVDLMGYIEDTKRIGKFREKHRPLIIELISKRMVKYLLEHSYLLQGTGVNISPLLDENTRKERKILRDKMMTARRNGLYAIIRDNQLYIQGKKVDLSEEDKNVENNQNYNGIEPELGEKTCNKNTTNNQERTKSYNQNHSFRYPRDNRTCQDNQSHSFRHHRDNRTC